MKDNLDKNNSNCKKLIKLKKKKKNKNYIMNF